MASEPPLVKLNRLSSSESVDGWLLSWHRRQAKVRVNFENFRPPLVVRALLEMQDNQMIYLGEVSSIDSSTLTLEVEHAIDRVKLGAIQSVWGLGE